MMGAVAMLTVIPHPHDGGDGEWVGGYLAKVLDCFILPLGGEGPSPNKKLKLSTESRTTSVTAMVPGSHDKGEQ